METKLAGKSILVVDVISERCWSASEANGVELMTPRRVFFGGGLEDLAWLRCQSNVTLGANDTGAWTPNSVHENP